MSESISHASGKLGLPPGSLVHVGEVKTEATNITVIDYTHDEIRQFSADTIDQLLPYFSQNSVTWIDIAGLTNVSIIESIGEHLDIHPLVLEDVLNTKQRSKLEIYEHYLFFVAKAVCGAGDSLTIQYEQISMLVLNNCLITFRESADDLFSPIQRRLENSQGRFRNHGTDYLAYAILDTIVDQYFVINEMLDPAFEAIEEELLNSPSTQTLATIQKIKRELVYLRKTVSPLRELLSQVHRNDSELIQERTLIYFADVFDHALRIVESLDSYRDLATGMLDIYLSSVSNKMNETMKVLTVFASIFIPLTFIAGIYGMNFEHMPELKWKWSYPLLWVLFITIPVALIVYFRRKQWL